MEMNSSRIGSSKTTNRLYEIGLTTLKQMKEEEEEEGRGEQGEKEEDERNTHYWQIRIFEKVNILVTFLEKH